MYGNDPLAGTLPGQEDRIIGGEAAMWSEVVGVGDILQKVFPRSSAYGGRLWKYTDPLSSKDAGISMSFTTLLRNRNRN